MSKRDEALFAAQDVLQFAYQKVNEAQLLCKALRDYDAMSELEHALDHTREAIDWLKITRGREAPAPSTGVTEDDVLNAIEDGDMYDANAAAVARSVYAMLKSKGVVQ